MTVDPFRCRCTLPCTERATQEDMLCDTCRLGGGKHVHYALIGQDGDGMTPLALAEPLRITFAPCSN